MNHLFQVGSMDQNRTKFAMQENEMDEQAPAYNLKAVTKETGLTPATLRAWERRYGLFKPQRSPGGHRLYSENEINLLKWLVERQKEGLSISRAIDLWRRQATQSPSQVQISPVSQMMPAMGEGMLDQLRQNWCEACLAFNEPDAELAMAKGPGHCDTRSGLHSRTAKRTG